jgi:hypothetical protein
VERIVVLETTFCRDNSTNKTVQYFGSRQKDFGRFLQQQQPKKFKFGAK